MENNKLSKVANTFDIFAKVGGGIFLAGSIVCGVAAILSLIFGGTMFETARYSLSMDYITVYITEGIRPHILMLHAVLGCAGGCVLMLCAWYAARTLRKILAPMKLGRPFEPGTDREVRKLGVFTLVFGAIGAAVRTAVLTVITGGYPVARMFDPAVISRVETNVGVELDFLWVAAMIFFLSYIFSYGQQLQLESDETL